MSRSEDGVVGELRRLIRRIAGVSEERSREKKRARFWAEVRDGESEAAANSGDFGVPAVEKTLRHRRRSREA